MTFKRIRTHRAMVAMAIALAPSTGIAGCAPSHFNTADVGTSTMPSTPAPGQQGAGNTGANTNQGDGGTGTTPVTPASQSLLNFSGTAFAHTGVLANANITVVDALSNQPVGIVAQGAGNIVAQGAGNYVLAQAGGATTDANGNFNVSINQPTPGNAVRMIVSNGTVTVTMLCVASADGTVTAFGSPPSAATGYQLAQQTAQGSTTVQTPTGATATGGAAGSTAVAGGSSVGGLSSTAVVAGVVAVAAITGIQSAPSGSNRKTTDLKTNVTTSSTAADQVTSAQLSATSGLNESARSSIIDGIITFITQQLPAIETTLKNNPSLLADIETKADAKTGSVPATTIKDLLDKAGILGTVQDKLKTVAQSVADKSNDPKNLSSVDQPLDPDVFARLGVTLSNGQLTINGTTINLSGSNGSNTGNGSTGTPDSSTAGATDGSDGASNTGNDVGAVPTAGNPVFHGGNFTPKVTLAYTGGIMYVDVTQPAGQDSIGSFMARLPGTGLFHNVTDPIGKGWTNAPGSAAHVSSTTAAPGLYIHAVPGGTAPFSPSVPPLFGADSLQQSELKYDGFIYSTSSPTARSGKVARFQIFEHAGYTYLATNFDGSSAADVTSAGSHTILQTGAGVLTLSGSSINAPIVSYSRGSESAEYSENISSTVPGPAL